MVLGLFMLATMLATLPFELRAQIGAPPTATPAGASRTPSTRAAPGNSLTGLPTAWAELTGRQRAALQPLQHRWTEITPDHQQKWIEIATRFPSLPPEEQARIQARMTEWAQLSPQERGRARLRFQEAKRLPPIDRQARWEEFQALTPEQRHELSERAAQAARNAAAPSGGSSAARLAAQHRQNASALRDDALPKAAAASDSLRTSREEAIAPAIVQAKPGATTTLMSKRTSVTPHPKASTPKIAAASDTINAATLLPRKVPPPAAITPPAAAPVPAPDAQPVSASPTAPAIPANATQRQPNDNYVNP